MTNVVNIEEAKKKNSEVIEVATNHLTLHSKQESLSPNMSDKQWKKFVNGIKENGVLQPISVTKGFRIIDGKHRLLAAKELGIEGVRVVIEDIPENEVATYIVENKLNRSELKNGQRAAMVIRLYYEELKAEGRERMSLGGKGGLEEGVPKLEQVENSGRTNELLAKKAGIGKSSMAYLIAVYCNRLDLFEKVFDGSYSINKAYTQMKADEEPEKEEPDFVSEEKEQLSKEREEEKERPQIDDTKPTHYLDNRIVMMRKNALNLTAEVLDECDKLANTDEEIRNTAKNQLLSLGRAIAITLGRNSESETEADTYAVIYELMNKLKGDD